MTKPKYPVVDPDPSVGRFIANFGLGDCCKIAGMTALGYAVGFLGAQRKLRGSHARFCAFLGLAGGLALASQSSYLRLMGHRENKAEVRRYGVHNAEDEKTA